MKSMILLLTALGVVLAQEELTEELIIKEIIFEEHWESFKVDYEKFYGDYNTELIRKQVFKDNKDLIDKHNLRYKAGKESYMMGVNEFTDLMPAEFFDLFTDSQERSAFQSDYLYTPALSADLPESVNWRTKGAVSGVKHQHNCSSGWAFAAVGTLEGLHYIKTKKLLEFSAQNLLDCSSLTPYKNLGCSGGTPEEALQYVSKNHGINTRLSYAYEGHASKCRFKSNRIGMIIQGSVTVKSENETALEQAVAMKGPIAVTIDATNLQHYRSGVYNTPCTGPAHNHSILLIGYGTDPKRGKFWILKNSWGKWGEEGYFRMSRRSNNLCGIANSAVFPII